MKKRASSCAHLIEQRTTVGIVGTRNGVIEECGVCGMQRTIIIAPRMEGRWFRPFDVRFSSIGTDRLGPDAKESPR